MKVELTDWEYWLIRVLLEEHEDEVQSYPKKGQDGQEYLPKVWALIAKLQKEG